MFRKSIAAAMLVAGAAFVPAVAQAATGFTVESTELRAGPDYDYPTIRVINDDRRVEIYGCLNDWSFCDVGYRSDRGWVDGRDIAVDYRARRVGLVDAGPYVGIGFLSFSFGNYWDNYYRGRPFYHDRGRWERHYHDSWRTSWGPRRDRDWNDRNHRDDRDWNDRNRRDGRDWNDRDHRDGRDRNDNDRRGDNDRRDNDRRDNDRGDNDNRTRYKGAPNNPAVATPTPQPRPGVTERANDRRDGDRGDRNRSSNSDRSMPSATPSPRPTPQATTQPQAAPSRPAVDNDRTNRGRDGDRPNRTAMARPERGDAQDAGARREKPRETPSQPREDWEPRHKRTLDPDEENRPGH